MKRTRLHALNPESARNRIKAAKSNEPFMAALLNRDHRGHSKAVQQWTRLHEAAYKEKPSGRAREIKPLHTDMPSTAENRQSQSQLEVAESGIDDWLADRAREAAGSQDDNEQELPVVNMSADRVQILQDDLPALFEIEENSDADPSYGVWRSSHPSGANAVRRHDATIAREAARQGVDPDWVRAIMYVENAHGYYGVPFQALGLRIPSFR